MSNMVLPLRRRRKRQPQVAAGIDWSNPITRGLVVCISGAQPLINIALKRPTQFVGSPGKKINNDGVNTDFTRASTQGISVGTSAVFNPAAMTLLSIYTPKSISVASAHMLFSRDDNSLGRAFSLDLHWNSGYGARYYVVGGGSVGTNELRQGVSPVVGKRYVVAARQTGSAAALFVDGALVSSSAAFTAKPSATGDTRIGIRTYSGSNEAADGYMPWSLMWSRALSDLEIESVSQNPLQILLPDMRGLFVPVSAGGSALAAAGAASAGGSASIAAQVALAAVGVATASGSAGLSTAIPLSAVGFAVSGGAANAVATVTISAAGLAQAAGSAGLSAAVLLQGAGAAQAAGNAALAAQLNALASGAAQASGTANLSGGAPGSLSAADGAVASGTAVLSVTVGLTASGSGEASGIASLSGGAAGQVAAVGGAQAGGSAVLRATVSLTAAGFVQAMGAGYLTLSLPFSGFAPLKMAAAHQRLNHLSISARRLSQLRSEVSHG